MSTQHEEAVASEDATRLKLMQSRLVKLEATEVKIRKLNHVLGSMAVSERPRQLSLLKQASAYVAKIADDAPAGVNASLVIIANELQSLREGLAAKSIKSKDMVLLSGVRAVKSIGEIKAKLQGHITRAEARLSEVTAGSPAENLLLRTKEISTQIPNLNGKDYAVIRAPVAFSFASPNGKHTSVGYVDSNKLTQLGFKVENLEGYTIIHNQMLIGVNTDAVKNTEGKDGKYLVDMITEKAIKFKGGMPVKVQTKRPKTLADVAAEVVKLIELKTKTPYTLVSATPSRHSAALWYWAAPVKDVMRMGKAFPGGHAKVTQWGPAFPVEHNELELRQAKQKEQQERLKRGEKPIKQEPR